MRPRFPIVALFAALLTLAGQAPAQQQKPPAQSDAVPDAPQPQKKKAEKPTPPPDAPAEGSPENTPPPAPDAKSPAGKNDNAFPEALSRDAAARAAQEDKDSSPEAPSSAQTPDGAKRPASEGNPFPEDVSKDAAKAAGKEAAPETVPRSSVPPGVSSSQSQPSNGGDDQGVPFSDPARSKKDTEVGTFYLKTGNVQGALLRYKAASAADPTNVAAIFGLAETERMLGNAADAARNYQLYLDIVPNGPKAKESMKALKVLQAQK
jgi:tetratricopeptide (TPR) repeat protein